MQQFKDKYTLRQARNLAGLSQREVAERIGKTTQTVSFWESGQSTISASDFVMLCSMYKVSRDQIILP